MRFKLFTSILLGLALLFHPVSPLQINPAVAMVSAENPRASAVGNGVITQFFYDYKIFQSSDLLVYVDNLLQILNTHYTVSMNSGGIGGKITFGGSYIPALTKVVDIVRSIPLTQSMDLMEGQRLPAETLEATFDKQTMTLQDINSKLSLLLAGGGILPIDPNIIYSMFQGGGYNSFLSHTIITLVNDATPSVLNGRIFLTGGTTTITDFDDGITGQIITIIAEHTLIITDGTNIFLNGSANFTMNATDTLTLIQKADGKWYEIGRSDNT